MAGEAPNTGEVKGPPPARVMPAGEVVRADDRPAAKPLKWASELVRGLADTGTGAEKLAAVQKARVAKFDDPGHAGKPPTHPDRHLTAEEGLAAIEAAFPDSPLTLEKARQLVRTGCYVPAVVGPVPADAHVPASPDAAADDAGEAEAKAGATGGRSDGRTGEQPDAADARDDGDKAGKAAAAGEHQRAGAGEAKAREHADKAPGVGEARPHGGGHGHRGAGK
jgi:hypothetical protein